MEVRAYHTFPIFDQLLYFGPRCFFIGSSGSLGLSLKVVRRAIVWVSLAGSAFEPHSDRIVVLLKRDVRSDF